VKNGDYFVHYSYGMLWYEFIVFFFRIHLHPQLAREYVMYGMRIISAVCIFGRILIKYCFSKKYIMFSFLNFQYSYVQWKHTEL